MARLKTVATVGTSAIAAAVAIAGGWQVLQKLVSWPDPEPWHFGIVYEGVADSSFTPPEATLILLRGRVVGRVELFRRTAPPQLLITGDQIETTRSSHSDGQCPSGCTIPLVVSRELRLPADTTFTVRRVGNQPAIVLSEGESRRNLQPGERVEVRVSGY